MTAHEERAATVEFLVRLLIYAAIIALWGVLAYAVFSQFDFRSWQDRQEQADGWR